jgi:hypothetical protein
MFKGYNGPSRDGDDVVRVSRSVFRWAVFVGRLRDWLERECITS